MNIYDIIIGTAQLIHLLILLLIVNELHSNRCGWRPTISKYFLEDAYVLKLI
jgi:hypothetical protein